MTVLHAWPRRFGDARVGQAEGVQHRVDAGAEKPDGSLPGLFEGRREQVADAHFEAERSGGLLGPPA